MIKSGYNSLNESIKYKDTDKIKYLYHSVFSNASKKYVLENGIKSDDQGWIYLSEKPIINSRVVAVFKVRIPDNRKLYDWREIWFMIWMVMNMT